MDDQDAKKLSKSLHSIRGLGGGSRIRLNTVKLEDAGWTITMRESEKRLHFSFVDPEGRKYKSAKDVEQKLGSDGLLHRFLKEETLEVSSPNSAPSTSKGSLDESDENFEPPPEKKRATEGIMKSG